MDKGKKDIRIKAESCYNKDLHPLLIESLLQNGVNANEIIKKLGITPGIYRYWAKNFPEVRNAIEKGKQPVDLKIVSALYKNAAGYIVKEITRKTHTITASDAKLIEDGFEDKVPKEDVIIREKHVPPNVIAQIFWLKNRLPNDWKDDHSLDVNSKAIYTITAAPSVEDANRVKEIGSKKIEEDIEKDYKDFSEKNNVLQIADNDDMIIDDIEADDD